MRFGYHYWRGFAARSRASAKSTADKGTRQLPIRWKRLQAQDFQIFLARRHVRFLKKLNLRQILIISKPITPLLE